MIGFWAGRTENKQSQKMTKNRSFSGFFLSKSKIHRKFTFNLFYLHNYKWPILCKIRRVISVKRFSIDRGVTVKIGHTRIGCKGKVYPLGYANHPHNEQSPHRGYFMSVNKKEF